MDTSMNTVYLLCATVGGTVLVVQTILLVIGVGADTDADVDPGDVHDGDVGHYAHGHDSGHAHDADASLKLLSFKTIVAFLTFFGLAGLAAQKGGTGPGPTLGIAALAGTGALYLVAYLMAAMTRLHSQGNLDVQNAVGQTATVYLRVPEGKSGHGKVTVAVQGRRVQLKAVTPGAEIPTGAEVRVVAAPASDTVEVVPAERS